MVTISESALGDGAGCLISPGAQDGTPAMGCGMLALLESQSVGRCELLPNGCSELD